jgi:hypothetical protein
MTAAAPVPTQCDTPLAAQTGQLYPQPGGLTIVSQGGTFSAAAITGAPLPSGGFNFPLR